MSHLEFQDGSLLWQQATEVNNDRRKNEKTMERCWRWVKR